MRKLFVIISAILLSLPVYALEDCLVISDAKLSDISIEDNTVIDVFPLITIMNDKKTLVVHPLKIGKTRFGILKGGKDIILFNVTVEENDTTIDKHDGFEILQIDSPPNYYDYELDEPPVITKMKGN